MYLVIVRVPGFTQACYRNNLAQKIVRMCVLLDAVVNSINCFATVNHRLAGPGIMVKLHLLFVGREVC
jgi:hypothetical protein